MRNTQNQQTITSYGRNESLSEFYEVYSGVLLKLLQCLLQKLGESVSIIIEIGVRFCMTTSMF